jgi:hypothetical protein
MFTEIHNLVKAALRVGEPVLVNDDARIHLSSELAALYGGCSREMAMAPLSVEDMAEDTTVANMALVAASHMEVPVDTLVDSQWARRLSFFSTD